MNCAAAAPRISVRNSQRKLHVDLQPLHQFAERALREAMQLQIDVSSAFDVLEEISVAIVSDARMAALHRRFMNIAGPTDVLTFQHGEIVVSAETAQRNASQYRTTAEDEIRLYIVHGILHLMGFDDTTAVAARTMTKAQKRIFIAVSRPDRAAPRGRGAV